MDTLKLKFDRFRRMYLGKTRGLETEWDNFIKKYPKEVKEILKVLNEDVIIAYRKDQPDPKYWKHFQTFINQRAWEYYLPENNITETISPAMHLKNLPFSKTTWRDGSVNMIPEHITTHQERIDYLFKFLDYIIQIGLVEIDNSTKNRIEKDMLNNPMITKYDSKGLYQYFKGYWDFKYN